jgi:hypothetical protein
VPSGLVSFDRAPRGLRPPTGMQVTDETGRREVHRSRVH